MSIEFSANASLRYNDGHLENFTYSPMLVTTRTNDELAKTVISYIAIVFGVLSIGLNIIFLFAMHFFKDKVTAYHRYLQNLAISDMLASCTFLLLQDDSRLTKCIAPFVDVILLQGLPYVIRSLPWMFFNSYLLTLSCLTINQYVAVCRPWRYNELVTNNRILFSLVFVWTFSSLQLLVPVTILVVLYILQDSNLTTATLYSVSKIEMQIWMGIFIFSTVLNIFLNLFIYRKIRHLKLKRRMNSHSSNMESVNIRTKQAAFVTVSLLLLASVFCRLPFPLTAIISLSYSDSKPLLNASVLLLLYLNFFADPIIYLLRMREVQRSYKQLLRRCLPWRFPESERYCRQTSTRLMTIPDCAGESINTTVDVVELRSRGDCSPSTAV